MLRKSSSINQPKAKAKGGDIIYPSLVVKMKGGRDDTASSRHQTRLKEQNQSTIKLQIMESTNLKFKINDDDDKDSVISRSSYNSRSSNPQPKPPPRQSLFAESISKPQPQYVYLPGNYNNPEIKFMENKNEKDSDKDSLFSDTSFYSERTASYAPSKSSSNNTSIYNSNPNPISNLETEFYYEGDEDGLELDIGDSASEASASTYRPMPSEVSMRTGSFKPTQSEISTHTRSFKHEFQSPSPSPIFGESSSLQPENEEILQSVDDVSSEDVRMKNSKTLVTKQIRVKRIEQKLIDALDSQESTKKTQSKMEQNKQEKLNQRLQKSKDLNKAKDVRKKNKPPNL